MYDYIEELQGQVKSNVSAHQNAFFDKFKGEMYNIRMKYRDLQKNINDNLKKMKLDTINKEIIDRKVERDWFKNECTKLDTQCFQKQEKLVKIKNMNNELHQEKKFIQEQI